MGLLGKAFAVVMFPLSILILLENTGVFSVTLPFLPLSKIQIGALLMIALQVITLIMIKVTHADMSFMNLVTGIVFIGVAVIALLPQFIPVDMPFGLILSVMMFVEAIYALH